jgi:hypothetical protein
MSWIKADREKVANCIVVERMTSHCLSQASMLGTLISCAMQLSMHAPQCRYR